MKFSPKYGTENLGTTYIILGSICSLLNWEGAHIGPQIRLRKIPAVKASMMTAGDDIISLYFEKIVFMISRES